MATPRKARTPASCAASIRAAFTPMPARCTSVSSRLAWVLSLRRLNQRHSACNSAAMALLRRSSTSPVRSRTLAKSRATRSAARSDMATKNSINTAPKPG